MAANSDIRNLVDWVEKPYREHRVSDEEKAVPSGLAWLRPTGISIGNMPMLTAIYRYSTASPVDQSVDQPGGPVLGDAGAPLRVAALYVGLATFYCVRGGHGMVQGSALQSRQFWKAHRQSPPQ
jgi:hypothetical protein